MPAIGNSMRKKGWGQGFEGCWGEAGSAQRGEAVQKAEEQ